MVTLLSLPPELLAIIVGYLPKSTVSSLSIANLAFYRLFCSYLYRSVRNALWTLSLPQNERNLSPLNRDLPHPAAYVVECYISIYLGSGIHPLDPGLDRKKEEHKRLVCGGLHRSMQNMLNCGGKLRRLEYSSIDLPFHDAFQDTCLGELALETLYLDGEVGMESLVGDSTLNNVLGEGMTVLKLQISSLRESEYVTSTISRMPKLCPNLSSLTLEFRLQPEGSIIDAVLGLQLPELRSLSIKYQCDTSHQVINPCIVLQHNPNIKYLSLPLAKATILPDLARSLTAFEGTYKDCTHILIVQPLLTTLKIDLALSYIFAESFSESSPHYEEEKCLLAGLRGASFLAHLVVVHNDLSESGWADDYGVSMEGFKKIVNTCPNLQRLECLLRPTEDIATVCPAVIGNLKQLRQLKFYIYQNYDFEDYYEDFTIEASDKGLGAKPPSRSVSRSSSGLGNQSGSEPDSEPSSELESDNESNYNTPVRFDPSYMKQKRLEKMASQIAQHLAPVLPCLQTVDLEVRGYDHDNPERGFDDPDYEDSFTYEVLPPLTDGSRFILGNFREKTRTCLGTDGEGKLLWKEEWGVTEVLGVPIS